MPRRLGKSGERRFATLVSEYEGGASCNDSTEDLHGWDHVVQFDQGRMVDGLPANMIGAMPPCFVQTKTTSSPVLRRVSIKLSNALAFTQSDNPCFLVFVSSPPDGPVRYYAIHWWNGEMERALRRARQLHAQNVGHGELHRHSVQIEFKPCDAKNERELIGWLRDTVLSIGGNYGQAKAKMRASIGYDGAWLVGNLQVGPLKSLEELVDHQLGLTPGLPISEVTLRHRRFGVDVPLPVPEGPYADARLRARPAAACEVRVQGPEGESFTILGELFVPAIGGIPAEILKYRIRTDMFDLVWKPGAESRLTSTLNTVDRMSPMELAERALFFSWSGAGTIDIMARVAGDRLLGATAPLDNLPDAAGWCRIAPPLGTLARIAAGQRGRDPLISVEEVMKALDLQLLHEVLTATSTNLDATLRPGGDPGDFNHAVAFAATNVGEWNFAALLRMPLTSRSIEGDQLQVVFGPVAILETYVGHVSDSTPIEQLTADYRRHAARAGAFELDNLLLQLAGNYFD